MDYSTWAQCEHLLSQALTAAQLIEQHHIVSEEAGRLLYETAAYLQERARYQGAESLFLHTLHIREQQFGPEHPDVARSLNGLANLYQLQGKYAETERLHQRALHIREQQLGPEHPDTAETMHDLARYWEAQGNNEDACTWYTRALAIREQALGAHHPLTTQTRTRLIALLHTMGLHKGATRLEAAQSEQRTPDEEPNAHIAE